MIHKRKTDTAIIQEYAWVLSHNAPGLYNFENILSISEKLRLKDELINKYHAKVVSYAQIHEDVIGMDLAGKSIVDISKSIMETYQSEILVLLGRQSYKIKYIDEESKMHLIISDLSENRVVVCV